MTAYYNEWDSQAAAWLRELIRRGHIAPGDVDERSITDVQPDEIKGYTQHHFFAGIGGWSLALRSAGWPDTRPVFTGSPPCQPFSTAGRGGGYADDRHLAPQWLRLVKALRPAFVFGEQVAAAVKKDDWLDDLLDALEGEGYATGSVVLPACGVGAPHIRQRLWVVARLEDANSADPQQFARKGSVPDEADGAGSFSEPDGRGDTSRLADANHSQRKGARLSGGMEPEHTRPRNSGTFIGLADTNRRQRQGLADDEGCQPDREAPGRQQGDDGSVGVHKVGISGEYPDPAQTGWDDPDWLYCRDGNWRPVESGTFPLADGLSARVGRLRGYGNAIVPQVAEEIIREIMHGDNE